MLNATILEIRNYQLLADLNLVWVVQLIGIRFKDFLVRESPVSNILRDTG